MICQVCLSSLFGKILSSIGQGTRFRLVTYEGNIKQGYEIRGRATDPEPKAQFGFGHLGAALWLHTRPEIKAQFGSGHLDAVQNPKRFFLILFLFFILISNHIFIFLSKFGGRKPFLCFIYLILHMNFTTYSLIFFIPLVDSEKGIYN